MKNKGRIDTFILIIVALLILWFTCTYFWLESAVKRSKVQAEKNNTFIDNCIQSGGKVEEIGSWYTSNHLVCYPFKEN